MGGANVAAFGDDGLGGELAYLELVPFRVIFGLRLFVPNRDVLIAWQYRATFFLSTVGRADLHQLGLRGDGLCDVGRDFRLTAVGIGALCGIWANCNPFLLASRCRVARVANCQFVSKPPLIWNRTTPPAFARNQVDALDVRKI
jgi:hypothetical protein